MVVVMKKAQKETRNIVMKISSMPLGAKKVTPKLPQVIIWQTVLYILYPRGLGNWRKAIVESMIHERMPEMQRIHALMHGITSSYNVNARV